MIDYSPSSLDSVQTRDERLEYMTWEFGYADPFWDEYGDDGSRANIGWRTQQFALWGEAALSDGS